MVRGVGLLVEVATARGLACVPLGPLEPAALGLPRLNWRGSKACATFRASGTAYAGFGFIYFA